MAGGLGARTDGNDRDDGSDDRKPCLVPNLHCWPRSWVYVSVQVDKFFVMGYNDTRSHICIKETDYEF